MAFVNYKNTNNASSLLISDITASATTILITDWDQDLFPSNFPFLLTLEHLDTNENVILREIVKVVSSNQNTFTVERSAWTCVQDDTATNRAQDNTAHAFYSWDRVSLYWTAEQVQDIQNNLELKWNQDAIANVYDSSLTYAVWDVVVYKGDRYQNTTAVETPEEFDPTKWTKVNVQYTLDDHQTQIDDINTTISQLWGIRKVDVLVLGWWGWGWWGWRWNDWSSNCATWWWGWAWQLKVIEWVALKNNVFSVVVWNWWAWWNKGCTWTNWCNSNFWKIVAIGWGAWWGGWWSWNCCKCGRGCDWWNGWWSWGWGWENRPNLRTRWGSWAFWWHSWAIAFCASWFEIPYAWWGWGWVWWDWWNWFYPAPWQQVVYWTQTGGKWIAINFWWTLRCLWWGWSSANDYWQDHFYWWCGTWLCNSCALDWTYWWACFGWWRSSNMTPCNWTANTWWWGWGWMKTWFNQVWWNGWSWLVIVRYPTDCSYWIKTATWGTITTATIDWIEYKVHTFTSSWTFCITESV